MTDATAPPPPNVPRLFLASASPRRQALLRQIGLDVEPLAPGPDENADALEVPLPQELPLAYVRRVAAAKMDAALARLARRHPEVHPQHAGLLCADTIVALGTELLGKPRDADDARRMLRALSGRQHAVHTAVVVQRGGQRHAAVQTSQVWFAKLRERDIDAYLASGEPFGKAGAYALQGRGEAFVTRIDGSASGIIGLPLHTTLHLLRRIGCAA